MCHSFPIKQIYVKQLEMHWPTIKGFSDFSGHIYNNEHVCFTGNNIKEYSINDNKNKLLIINNNSNKYK